MNDADRECRERRLLTLLPTGRDAALTASILTDAGIDCCACTSIRELAQKLNDGAGAILVAEEAISEDEGRLLAAILDQQPPWSDLPVLVVTRQGADSSAAEQAVANPGQRDPSGTADSHFGFSQRGAHGAAGETTPVPVSRAVRGVAAERTQPDRLL